MRIKVLAVCLFFMVHLWLPGVTCTNVKRRWPRTTVLFDDTCPRDCSQSKRRIDGDDTIFNCSVGNLAEVENFRKNYKTRMEEAKINFDPPKLIDIDVYHKQFSNYKEAALNITFRLPKGKTDSYNEIEYPLAIFLNFTSVKDSQYSDKYYSNSLRQRIFQFWEYKPKTNFDSEYPREISYDCMVGLDDSKPIRVYVITLETAFGRKVMYNCTVYVQQGRDAGYIIDWRPTIATSLSVDDKSIHVVFDEYPHVLDLYDRNIYYNVSLLDSDRRPVRHKKLKQGTHETVFGNLKHGTFFIRVAKCEETLNFDAYVSANNIKNDECISLDSYAIDAARIPEDIHGTPIFNTEAHVTLYVVMALGLGCLIGIALVAAAVCVIVKENKKPPRRCSSFHGEQMEMVLSRLTSDHTINYMDEFLRINQSQSTLASEAKGDHTTNYMDEFLRINQSQSTLASEAKGEYHEWESDTSEIEPILVNQNSFKDAEPEAEVQFDHNKYTLVDSEQRNQGCPVSQFHHDHIEQYRHCKIPRDPYHLHVGTLDNVSNLCPIHGIRNPIIHSPDLNDG